MKGEISSKNIPISGGAHLIKLKKNQKFQTEVYKKRKKNSVVNVWKIATTQKDVGLGLVKGIAV